MTETRKIAFIDGDVTLRATARPEAAALAPITFTYRPVTAPVKARFISDTQGAPGNILIAAQDLVAKQVTSWDIQNSHGEAVAVTAANVQRIPAETLSIMATLIIESADEAEAARGN
jgi:hypothetical protein